MNYAAITFLIFTAIIGLIYFLIPKRFRWIVLLIGSYIFYVSNSGWLVVFIILTTLSVYFSGIVLTNINNNFKLKKEGLPKEESKKLKSRSDSQKKLLIAATFLVNFGVLFLLKYLNFFSKGVNLLFDVFDMQARLSSVNWLMPLGISYYTLQSAGYVLDVYRGKINAERNFGKLALFVSFFPQIVEGPIGRYDKLAETLYEGQSFDYDRFRSGGQLIIWGFFKKMVIADRAALPVSTVFSDYTQYSGLSVIIAVLLFTLQIYAEFSGSIDIVTGVSQIFGVTLDANFKRPFFSKSIAEFWRRWHITLGAWLRDYIFYPVSMSKLYRKSSKKIKEKTGDYFSKLLPMAAALFPVWFCMGIWHGASFKYILYGIYYYVFLILGEAFKPISEKILTMLKVKTESACYHLFQMTRSFVIVFFGMLLFRSKSISAALQIFKSIFFGFTLHSLTDGSLLKLGLNVSDYVLLLACCVLLIVVGYLQERNYKIREIITKRNIAIRWAIYLIAIFSIIIFGVYGNEYNVGTFIYGNF